MSGLLNSYGAMGDAEALMERVKIFYAVKHSFRRTAQAFGISLWTAHAIVHNKCKITARRIVRWKEQRLLACPILTKVAPEACAEHSRIARTSRAYKMSNPDRLRLYAACRRCQQGGCHASSN